MKHFKAIAAMSENRVIGMKGRIPWYLPGDFKWFKQTTTGQVIVMGRRTFESIGKRLPNRTTLVMSESHFNFPGVQTITNLGEIDLENEPREVFICGGARVYAMALAYCSDLYLTVVKRTVEGDAFFPKFEERFELADQVLDEAEFKILHYRNIRVESVKRAE